MSKHQKINPPSKQPAPVQRPVVAAPVVAAPVVAAPVVEKLVVAAPVVAAALALANPIAEKAKVVGVASLAPLFDFSRQLMSQVEKQSTWWLQHGLAPSLEVARAVAQYRSESFVAAQAMLKNVELLFRS